MSRRSVFDILRDRVRRGSRAPHGDGASVALAVEGGAMRGVISAGMVTALNALGFTQAFDAVYGSSAGAINAAYFLAGEAELGTSIYYRDINNSHFISLARALRRRPIVDLGYLLDDVAIRRKPLTVGRVLESPTPFTVMATDVETQSASPLAQFQSAAQLFAALRAGATMPVLAGPPRHYDGRQYLDASLTEPIPVPTAEAAGHSHVLVLLTRTGGMRPNVSAFDRYFIGPRLRRLSPALADRYLARAAPYSALMRAIDAGTGPLGRAQVTSIRVDGLHISKLERREAILEHGARRGYDAVIDAFASPS